MLALKTKGLLAISASILAMSFSAHALADEVYEDQETFSLPAQSSGPAWRVRGAIGLADINVDVANDDYDQAAAFDVALQKTIDEQVAIELGYVSFSDFDDEGTVNQSIGGEILKLSVVGYSAYTGQHRYFFRIGAFSSDLEATTGNFTSSDSDTGLFGGFGVGFRVAPQLSVTAELNHLFAVSNIDFTQVFLGLEYEI